MRVPVWTYDAEVEDAPDNREAYVDPVNLSDDGRDALARQWHTTRAEVDALIAHADG